jgi:CRP/FNR family transcriptional regulator, cyclic AMP receptor protein
MPDEDQKVALLRLAGLPFFCDLPQWALARIAQAATELCVPAGHMLVRQYDRATAVFVVLSGAVQILVRVGSDDLLVGVLRGEGELIGWSTFRPPCHYTASVRCEQPTVVVRVPATVFEELFDQDPELAYAILSRAAASVAERYELARDLLSAQPRRGPVGGNAP